MANILNKFLFAIDLYNNLQTVQDWLCVLTVASNLFLVQGTYCLY